MIGKLVSREPWRCLRFLALLLLADPVGAWYKHVASPRYHTVGRASGLLMGVRRSPYLWRRDLEEEARGSLEAAPQWMAPRQERRAGQEPWGAPLELPSQGAKGAPWTSTPSRRTGSRRALRRSRASRDLLAALWHRGTGWSPQCPPGCRETPWPRPPLDPQLLERVMLKKGQPGTAEEASVSESKI